MTKRKERIFQCGEAIDEVMSTGIVTNRVTFMNRMEELGWEVIWDERKHIYYSDEDGHLVKDTSVVKYTGVEATKIELLSSFYERLSIQIAFQELLRKEQEHAE